MALRSSSKEIIFHYGVNKSTHSTSIKKNVKQQLTGNSFIPPILAFRTARVANRRTNQQVDQKPHRRVVRRNDRAVVLAAAVARGWVEDSFNKCLVHRDACRYHITGGSVELDLLLIERLELTHLKST